MVGTQHAAPVPNTKVRSTAGRAVRGRRPRMSGSTTTSKVVSQASSPEL